MENEWMSRVEYRIMKYISGNVNNIYSFHICLKSLAYTEALELFAARFRFILP